MSAAGTLDAPGPEKATVTPRLPASVLDAAIDGVIGRGTYDRLYRRHFGADPGTSVHPYPPRRPRIFPPLRTARELLDRGTLRWGYAVMGPPFSSPTAAGDPEGWDVDLAEELTGVIARAYGRPLRAELIRLPGSPFPDRLFDALDRGEVDAVLSDLAITDARRKRVDFTQPYLCATFGLLCRDAATAARLPDLPAADRGETSVVILSKAFLNELADRYLPRARRVFVDDPRHLVETLHASDADAVLLPFASIHAYRREDPTLVPAEFCVGPGGLRAVAVCKKGPAPTP